MKYEVTFIEDGLSKVQTYRECKDVGMAFARAQKDHPGAKMISADAWGDTRYGEGHTFYSYPPVQRDPKKEPRPYRTPKPDEKDGVMPFYDQVVGQGR